MKRWIAMLAAVTVLTGCVTTREVVYREPYNEGTYYGDSSNYQGGGDYYSSPSYYGGYSSSFYDYPVYYSTFWSLNRWYVDPFRYPSYYYGVTWFPRNYFGLSYAYNAGWPSHYGWLSYSPYRYAWVDNYYDWRPWYSRNSNYRHYYPTPRYGDAHVEARRLADYRDRRYEPRGQRAEHMLIGRGTALPAYQGVRGANYGRNPATSRANTPINNPGRTAAGDVRRVEAGNPRLAPRTGVFGNPAREATSPRAGYPSNNGGVREIDRLSNQRRPVTAPQAPVTRPVIRDREAMDRNGYALPPRNSQPQRTVRQSNQFQQRVAPRESLGSPQPPVVRPSQQLPRSQPREVPSIRQSSPPRESFNGGGQRYVEPRQSYSQPAPQRSQPTSVPPRVSAPRPESNYSAPPSRNESSSRYEGNSSSNRSNSNSSHDSGVRRVGSNRER